MHPNLDDFAMMHDSGCAGQVFDTLLNRSINEARLRILAPLPNDLTRIIYLASLRDYNSGMYLHPELSREYDTPTAHSALQSCHREIFARLLDNSICEYVKQLSTYIRYAGAEERQFIATWESLKGYRATIPAGAIPLACELFFCNIDAALLVLKHRAK